MRKPDGIVFSIEQLFEDVRKALTDDIDVEAYVNPYSSQGLWRRLAGMIRVIWHQRDVNHITGDIHFLSIFLRRSKTILTIHDCVTLGRLSGFKYQVFRFLWYWLPAKRSAAITVISESTKKELLRHLGRGNWPIKVIPNFVSPDFEFSPKPFNSACPIILQVGTTLNKNIARVAVALKDFSCRMVIIGKLMPFQKAALEENKIDYESHFGISRELLVDHYKNCDIVMFASLYEGFGLPILEGQAVGRPVITSNLYSMPEVAGAGASFVDPYKIDEIATAVERIINDCDYRKNLIGRGRDNVKKYSRHSVAVQYADIYRNIYAARLR